MLQELFDRLKNIDFHKKNAFVIEDTKAYYALKLFLKKQNIPFTDRFYSMNEAAQNLYIQYQDNPSDENFLALLSHPLCEQHVCFVEAESHLEFPRRKIQHFPVSMKTLCREFYKYGEKGVKQTKDSLFQIYVGIGQI